LADVLCENYYGFQRFSPAKFLVLMYFAPIQRDLRLKIKAVQECLSTLDGHTDEKKYEAILTQFQSEYYAYLIKMASSVTPDVVVKSAPPLQWFTEHVVEKFDDKFGQCIRCFKSFVLKEVWGINASIDRVKAKYLHGEFWKYLATITQQHSSANCEGYNKLLRESLTDLLVPLFAQKRHKNKSLQNRIKTFINEDENFFKYNMHKCQNDAQSCVSLTLRHVETSNHIEWKHTIGKNELYPTFTKIIEDEICVNETGLVKVCTSVETKKMVFVHDLVSDIKRSKTTLLHKTTLPPLYLT